jgi:hypothetical protein
MQPSPRSTPSRSVALFAGAVLATGALWLSSAQTPEAPKERPPAQEGGRGPGRGARGGEDSPLHAAMEGLKADLRKLGGLLKAGDKQSDALAAVADMQRLVLEAKLLQPSNLPEIAEAGRPAHVLAYRKQMAELLQEVATLEIDVIDGENAAALELIKGRLTEMRDVGHEKFQPKDEQRERRGPPRGAKGEPPPK